MQAREEEERMRHDGGASGVDKAAVPLLDRGLAQLEKRRLDGDERVIDREPARDVP